MIDGSQLANYGVLGLWTATLLWEKYKLQAEWKTIVEKNTESNIRVIDALDDFTASQRRKK